MFISSRTLANVITLYMHSKQKDNIDQLLWKQRYV